MFTTVEQLRPDTRGHNLVVKVWPCVSTRAPKPTNTTQVVASKMVLNKQGGRGTRIAEVLLGDATGVIVFTAKNEQVDILAPGNYAVLRNARVDMFKGSMRLVVDQWGKVEAADDGTAFEPKVCVYWQHQ